MKRVRETKTTIHLDEAELLEAVKEYVLQRLDDEELINLVLDSHITIDADAQIDDFISIRGATITCLKEGEL